MMQSTKVAWLESQYLYPQHFQQQERYLETLVEQRCAAIAPFVWGYTELQLDPGALAEGRVALAAAAGLMPDGTPFRLPHASALPAPVKIPEGARDLKVHLVLPVYQPGARYLETGGGRDRVARYRLRTLDVFDYSGEAAKPEPVEGAELNFALALDTEDLGGYTALPVAQVRELTAEGAVVLESAWIPPALDVGRNPRLNAYLSDAIGLLRQRGEALAQRFGQGGRGGGASAIADFLLLQLVNRNEPHLRHLANLRMLHPERLFSELLGLMGELATFTTDGKRPLETPPYRHDDLYGCFQPLMDQLGRHLSAVLEQTAVPLPVEERQYGIRVARIVDRSLLKQARFVLAAKADLPTETVREQLPTLIKVGSVETIRELVNNQLPGIALSRLPVAPREVPYHAGCVYFELDGQSEHWQKLKNSGGFAFHVAGELPGFELELWAVRQ